MARAHQGGMRHCPPNSYDIGLEFVPMTHEAVWALMGATEEKRWERRNNYRHLCGLKPVARPIEKGRRK